ncbi:Biofilm regulatory protein A precursor [Arthrobacter saudimassiliensis]|uniref:Biofilm regulatory protein A n=1 Tax=Arthrobacter saudimassiliensis TaxID=1461584 RepID=A0A078MS22_9MICC|nr:Biofilm regulatory protein A precursor [Arthrobacter saudimassiliensis]
MSSRRASSAAGSSTRSAQPTARRTRVSGGRHLGRGGGSGHPALKAVAAALSLVLVAGLAFVGIQLIRLQNNFDTRPLDLSGNDNAAPAAAATDPLQILVLGTDNREGQESNNSDVMMLVHLGANREHVTVVSFPRDLLVPLPACTDPDTQTVYPAMELGQLNGALGNGGPGCTVAAINELTGLSIDHFMMADFNAVEELSNTLGGVEVCVNQAVDDPLSGLNIPAGVSTVQGEQALAFLRTRHGFGNGGDEGRIRAQQSFLSSMARKIQSEDTLNNLPKLYSIAETITRNLTVDEQLTDIPTLVGLAGRLKDVDLGRVAFVTAPVVPYELDNNRLVLDEPASQELFDALVNDEDITAGAEPEPEDTATAAPTEEAPAVDRAAVPVSLLDASAVGNRDAELAEFLLGEGFTQAVAGGQAALANPATQIFFSPGWEEAAAEVAAALNLPAVQVAAGTGFTGVLVQVGQDFTEGDRLADAETGGLGDLSGQTADQITCQSAFGY